MRIILLLSVTVQLLLFPSCKKDSVSKDSETVEVGEIPAFPCKVGDQWVYSVYDSLSKTTRTFPVTIVGTKKLHNGENVAIRVAEYESLNDTSYIAIDGDTVKIYTPEYNDGTTYYTFEKLRLIFPIGSTTKWTINYLLDSAFVLRTEDIAVPAGNFPNCHKVKIVQFGDERHGEQYIWLRDSVGLVYEWDHSFGMAPWAGTTWQLISYHVN